MEAIGPLLALFFFLTFAFWLSAKLIGLFLRIIFRTFIGPIPKEGHDRN